MGAEAKHKAASRMEHKRLKRLAFEHQSALRESQFSSSHRNGSLIIAAMILTTLLSGCGGEDSSPVSFDFSLPPYLSSQFDQTYSFPPDYADNLDFVKCPPIVSVSGENLLSVSFENNADTGLLVHFNPQGEGLEGFVSVTAQIQSVTSDGYCAVFAVGQGATTVDTRDTVCVQHDFKGKTIEADCDGPGSVTAEGITTGIVDGKAFFQISSPSGRTTFTTDDGHGNIFTEGTAAIGAHCPVVGGITYDRNDGQYKVPVTCDGPATLSSSVNQSSQSASPGETKMVPVDSQSGAQTTITTEANTLRLNEIFTAPTLDLSANPQGTPLGTVSIQNGLVKVSAFTCVDTAYNADCVINGQPVEKGQTVTDAAIGEATLGDGGQNPNLSVSDPAGRSTQLNIFQPSYNPFKDFQVVAKTTSRDKIDLVVTTNDPTQSVGNITVTGDQHPAMSDNSIWQRIETLVKGKTGTFTCTPTGGSPSTTQEFNCGLPYGAGGPLLELTVDARDVNGVPNPQPLSIDTAAYYSAIGSHPQILPSTAEKAYNTIPYFAFLALVLMGFNSFNKKKERDRKSQEIIRKNTFAESVIDTMLGTGGQEISKIIEQHTSLERYVKTSANKARASFSSSEWMDIISILTILEQINSAKNKEGCNGLREVSKRPGFARMMAEFSTKQGATARSSPEKKIYGYFFNAVKTIRAIWNTGALVQMQKLEDALANGGIKQDIFDTKTKQTTTFVSKELIGEDICKAVLELCSQEYREEKGESWFWKTIHTSMKKNESDNSETKRFKHIRKADLEIILIANLAYLKNVDEIVSPADALKLFKRHGSKSAPQQIERLRKVANNIRID